MDPSHIWKQTPFWILGCIIVLGYILFAHYQEKRAYDAKKIAQDIVSVCKTHADGSSCYENEVPRLYPKLSVSEIFEVIRHVRTQDVAYQFCHVLAHKLGERVVAEDPSSWIEAISLNPADGLCSNGFVHGVTGGRFRAEVLSSSTIEAFIDDFTAACVPRASWNASDLDRAICYHGMGHLYDFITDADIPKALALCSRTAPEEYERTCVEGVFMQIYQPLEPDDFELIKRMNPAPTKSTVRNYCALYKKSEYVGACLRESWPYFKEGIKDGTAVVTFCSGQPTVAQTEFCYQTVSALVGRMSLDAIEDIAQTCSNFPPAWQASCFGYGAESVLQEDRNEAAKAFSVCLLAPQSEQQACFKHLLSHANFIFGMATDSYYNFCKALPVALQDECLAGMQNL